MKGYQFLLQKSIDNYIVDFFCYDVVIEIDGDSHNNKITEDQTRQQRLELFGVCFLRFTDGDIKKNLNNVLESINIWIEQKQ